MKNVGFYVFPELLLLDVAGPMEVFSIANRYLTAGSGYNVMTVAVGNRAITASNGMALQAAQLLEECEEPIDLLLVAGGPGAYDGNHASAHGLLHRTCMEATRYGSICTGAFILGEMGLLDERRVTTHWNYTQRLAKAFPRASVLPDEIFIDHDGLLTSGGVTAGIDMALSVVAEDHGRDVALEVAKVILVSIRRQGGQARFSPLLRSADSEDSPIARVRQYILDNLHEEFCVERMATMAAMSRRNFARVFSRELQMTPTEFVQRARVDHARRLLETSTLPMKTVAHRSGFGSVRHMRSLFSENLGISPTEYRQQFG